MESEIAKIKHDREVCETVKLLHPRIWAKLSLEEKHTVADIIEGRIDKRAVDRALGHIHDGHAASDLPSKDFENGIETELEGYDNQT